MQVLSWAKDNFKTEGYEEIKALKAHAILQSACYDGNRNLTLDQYYNLVVKEFLQLEETGPVYTLTEAQKLNSFGNGLKGLTYINFSITSKREWKKIPANQQTFDTYYNSMLESYGIIQTLIYTPVYRVT